MKTKRHIKTRISAGSDPYDALASDVCGEPVHLTEKGKSTLLEMVLKLGGKQSMVLLFRYGLGKVCSQEEIGTMLSVTKVRIGQIEQKAIRRLRHHTRIRHLKQHLGVP